MKSEQMRRIKNFVRAEPAPPVRLTISFTALTVGPVLDRVRSVMSQVAAAETWPSDDQWKLQLPDWFVRSFEGHTIEEMLADPGSWDFGSWLDAMKHPGWEWWSSGSSGRRGVVECTAHAMPFSIEPLIFLLRAAGAKDITVDEI